jgi:hypothetical protein
MECKQNGHMPQHSKLCYWMHRQRLSIHIISIATENGDRP